MNTKCFRSEKHLFVEDDVMARGSLTPKEKAIKSLKDDGNYIFNRKSKKKAIDIALQEQVKYIQREIEDYIDELEKSNDMWRKSQDDIAWMIANKLNKLKQELLNPNKEKIK